MTQNYAEVRPQVNVKLPLPETPKKAVKVAISGFLKKEVLLKWNTFASPFYHQNSWWIRCSAQVWNDVSISFADNDTGNWKRCASR